MTNIFCIVGRSGAGKSYYYNSITLDSKFMKKAKLEPLVYGTTRPPRSGEKDGIDYNFMSVEDYNKINKNKLIEFRSYNRIDGTVYYFTLTDYIASKSQNLICTASLFQYESYRNWVNIENIKNPNSYKLYLIILDANVKNRLFRIVERRCKNDADIYEACRRIVEENAEFSQVSSRVPELIDPMSYNTVVYINTDNISNDNNLYNLNKIKDFILLKNI